MTPLETLAKNPSDKCKSNTERQDTQESTGHPKVSVLFAWGVEAKSTLIHVHLIGLNRLHDILSAKMKTILF